MPTSLRCPTCSAPLEVPHEFATTTRCTYCGAGVLLTERGGHVQAAAQQERHADAIGDVLRHLRADDKIGAIKAYREHFGVGLAEAKDAVDRIEAGQPGGDHPAREDRGAAPAAPPTRPAGSTNATWALVLALVTLIAGAFVYDAMKERAGAPTAPGAPAVTAPPSPVERVLGRGMAREVLRFGREGNGAGRFEDARSVAVDGAGRIYVAEYTGGRVQVFDSTGTFLTQWMADPERALLNMVADRQGTIYVVQGGDVHLVEGATGRRLGKLPRPGRHFYYQDVALSLDGSLWAITEESVVHLDRDGDVVQTIAIDQVVDEDASLEQVAVSGTGHVYVLDRWKGEIYHLDPNGRFLDRFGGNPERSSDMSPADVAIDGRGRVYVSDMGKGVRVYDAGGQQIGSFGGGVIFGIAFNDRDELFAARRNDKQVVKYRLTR